MSNRIRHGDTRTGDARAAAIDDVLRSGQPDIWLNFLVDYWNHHHEEILYDLKPDDLKPVYDLKPV